MIAHFSAWKRTLSSGTKAIRRVGKSPAGDAVAYSVSQNHQTCVEMAEGLVEQRWGSQLPSNVRDDLDLETPLLEEELQASSFLGHREIRSKRCSWVQTTAALLSLQLG